jgi:hypothetical protein
MDKFNKRVRALDPEDQPEPEARRPARTSQDGRGSGSRPPAQRKRDGCNSSSQSDKAPTRSWEFPEYDMATTQARVLKQLNEFIDFCGVDKSSACPSPPAVAQHVAWAERFRECLDDACNLTHVCGVCHSTVRRGLLPHLKAPAQGPPSSRWALHPRCSPAPPHHQHDR